ncbi:MAG: hypothetical protein M3O26_14795 [Pseudomonadota bacterium]|nr:hypothetical protein [Pseudomonadota bacterium]
MSLIAVRRRSVGIAPEFSALLGGAAPGLAAEARLTLRKQLEDERPH